MSILRHAIFCALLVAMGAGASWAAKPAVHVLEVEVFNSAEVREMAPGLRSMVASRLSGDAYSVVTGGEGAARAEFTLRTTVTRLGGVFSVDAELSARDPGVEGVRGYETVNGLDGLMKALEKVCDRVRARLGQLTAGEAPSALTPPLERHPPIGAGVSPSAEPVKPVAATPEQALQSFSEVAKIEGEALSLASGDFDRDGRIELLLALPREFLLFRETPSGLEKVWQGSNQIGFTPMLVGAADLDGDGAAEAVLTGASGPEGITQLYRWSGKGLEKVGAPVAALCRVTADRDGKPALVGMASSGGEAALTGEVRRYLFDGAKLTSGEKFALPNLTATLDFTWTSFGGGAPVLLLLDREHKLRFYNERLEQEAATEGPVMGSRAILEGARDARTGDVAATWELNSLPLTWKAPDGRDYALTHVNKQSSYTPGAWKSFESGALAALRWDGVALHKGGESPKFSGYVAGLARGGAGPDGRAKVYALLLKIEGLVFRDYSARLLAFDL